MIEIFEKDGSVTLTIRVVPRASKTEIAGEMAGALKVRVASPPVDGAANAEVTKFLAKTLGVARGDVEIVSGLASKTKKIRIAGVTAEQVKNALDLAE